MIDIYMTSFYRQHFTAEAVKQIRERTELGTYQLHIWDNGSDSSTREYLYHLLSMGQIASLHLDSRNTGCLYNKAVFQAMTESTNKYYVVTDNDIYPPKVSPDWLKQMIAIMDNYDDLAMLSPHILPVGLMGPIKSEHDVVFCKAVGNALKMVRREAFPGIGAYEQRLLAYGDDGLTSKIIRENGWRVAFCRHLFCYHAGQSDNWGYKPDEIHKDPRKQGYGKPFIVEQDPETYIPKDTRYLI